MNIRGSALGGTLALSVTILAFAALAQTPVPPIENPQPMAADSSSNISFVSTREFQLSVMILVLGLGALIGEYLLIKASAQKSHGLDMKLFIVTLIIVGSLLLIASGYNTSQISSVMGLFGTIAGYLLGKNEPTETAQRSSGS